MTLDPAKLQPGRERHERVHPGSNAVHYYYRAQDGELFTCITPSLAKCRAWRFDWLKKRGKG